MEYDSRISIAYDTIFYGVLYFNTEAYKQSMLKNYGIADTDLKYFYSLGESIPPPPPALYPFYYCDFKKASFLSDCFFNRFDFGQEDALSFFKRLLDHPSSFLNDLFQYYLKSSDETVYSRKAQFIQKIVELDYDHELLFQLINLWSDYKPVLQALYDFIVACYNAVSELFAKEECGLIRNLLRVFKREQFLDHLNAIPDIDYSKPSKKDRMGISLLNTPMILLKSTAEKHSFILGSHCHQYLDIHQNYDKTSPVTLCAALGDPLKAEILSYLNEKEYTVTQLSEKIFQSRQTINRHVLWLLDFMFITVAERKGLEVYYKINREFFIAAKDILDKYLLNFNRSYFLGDDRYENLEST